MKILYESISTTEIFDALGVTVTELVDIFYIDIVQSSSRIQQVLNGLRTSVERSKSIESYIRSQIRQFLIPVVVRKLHTADSQYVLADFILEIEQSAEYDKVVKLAMQYVDKN